MRCRVSLNNSRMFHCDQSNAYVKSGGRWNSVRLIDMNAGAPRIVFVKNSTMRAQGRLESAAHSSLPR